MSQITRRALTLLTLFFCAAAPLRLSAQETQRAGWEFGFRGIVLMNGFYNDAAVNNDELPTFALQSTRGPNPERTLGSTVRQTRLVATGDLADFHGGTLHAELDVDFFGATTGGTRTGPALRLRRMIAEGSWDRISLLLGQEGPLVADISPRGLAASSIPNFAGAGNLWLWIPQVRAGLDLNGGDGLVFGVDVAALSPTPPEGQPTGTPQMPTTAEMSGRPMLEGRFRARWGNAGEVSVGGHQAWLSTTADTLISTHLVVVGGIFPLGGVFELRGEWYTGRAAALLGGGGVGQLMNVGGTPVRSTGEWAQLNAKLGDRWEIGGGYGRDNPHGAQPTGNRQENQSYGGRIQWRLAPAIMAFEYRHFETDDADGIHTASHLNLAMGVEF